VAGVSTYHVASDGKCAVERLVSTYQLDANGNADSKYRDRQVAGLLFAIRYDWRTYFGGKYPNYMIAADGTKYAPGLPIITPTTIKNEFGTRARTQWAQTSAGSRTRASSRRTSSSNAPTTADLIGVPDLINRLHILRTRLDFLR
jgi:phage tail sheath gpL-like